MRVFGREKEEGGKKHLTALTADFCICNSAMVKYVPKKVLTKEKTNVKIELDIGV